MLRQAGNSLLWGSSLAWLWVEVLWGFWSTFQAFGEKNHLAPQHDTHVGEALKGCLRSAAPGKKLQNAWCIQSVTNLPELTFKSWYNTQTGASCFLNKSCHGPPIGPQPKPSGCWRLYYQKSFRPSALLECQFRCMLNSVVWSQNPVFLLLTAETLIQAKPFTGKLNCSMQAKTFCFRQSHKSCQAEGCNCCTRLSSLMDDNS